MASADLPNEDTIEEAAAAFSARIMQNALFHRLGTGVDAIDGALFQEAGFFQDVVIPALPEATLDVLASSDHSARAAIPDGPLVFVPDESGSKVVLEVVTLLLSPSREIRIATVNYITSSQGTSRSWICERTRDVVASVSEELTSSEPGWRAAALKAATAIREDVLAHFAGLRQSLAAHYREGIDQFSERAIRPTFNELRNIQPPLWSAKEQRSEILSLIDELSSRPTLEDALDQYLNRCGYVPLCGDIGASALSQKWLEAHVDSRISWDRIWSWATTVDSPTARYHALAIAISNGEWRPNGAVDTTMWQEIAAICNVADQDGAPIDDWQLYCDAANHYAHHIEALYPGQDGERVACYAWWLASQFGSLMWGQQGFAGEALLRVVKPETELSTRRWFIARSPIVPSPYRYFTLYVQSVWVIALLGELHRAVVPLSAVGLTPTLRGRIAPAVLAGMIPALMADHPDDTNGAFAFVGCSKTSAKGSLTSVLDAEQLSAVKFIASLRDSLGSQEQIRSALGELLTIPFENQKMMLLFLSSAILSTKNHDDVIRTWFADTDRLIEVVTTLPLEHLPTLLETALECQQRQWGDFGERLPHILAYVAEKSDDQERAQILLPYIILMSVNYGIISPIQRLHASRWRAIVADELTNWRDGMIHVARYSEPWIAARVRAAASAVSRMIGFPLLQSQPGQA